MPLVYIPTKDVLSARFAEIGMQHFQEKTTIIQNLACQQKAPLAVIMAVECAIADYIAYFEQNVTPENVLTQQILISMHKPLIIDAILRDHPEALRELQQCGLYVPVSAKNAMWLNQLQI